jgi:phytoene dehydrogenase-like protein
LGEGDKQVLTPLDLERRFGITGGNIFHGEMALDQMPATAPPSAACISAAPARTPAAE